MVKSQSQHYYEAMIYETLALINTGTILKQIHTYKLIEIGLNLSGELRATRATPFFLPLHSMVLQALCSLTTTLKFTQSFLLISHVK